MSFLPHISVTTTPGHENGASVKVAFIKKVLAPRLGSEEITEEREGPELAELDADTAHGVAKLLHETIELSAEIEQDDKDNKGASIDSFLDGDSRMGGEDHESDANALADAKNFNEQQSAVINWYRKLVGALTDPQNVCCPHCKGVPEWGKRNSEGEYTASSGCIVCGGIGYLEKRDDGALVKADPDAEPSGPLSPMQPSGDQFETVEEKTELQLIYDKMTNRAMDTITQATKKAQKLQCEFVATEHLLAALAGGGNSVAATALRNLKVDLKKLASELSALSVPAGASKPVAYTPQAKEALLIAEQERVKMGHTRIGTEHMLLGLMRTINTVSEQPLTKLGVSKDAVIKEVYDLLGYDPSENPGCMDPT